MTKETNSALGVPIAIVLAGGLIALAIYMGGRQPAPVTTTAGTGNTVATSATPTPEIKFRDISPTDHIRGAAQAKVTILEYSDLECPFCKQFHPVLEKILQEYPNDVRWVYRHYPIAQLHSQAPAESVASECAGEQGKFWEFIDKIYATTPANNGLDLKKLPDIARQVGVPNIPTFTSCLTTTKYNDLIEADIQDAQSAGATGTPYSVVIGPKGEKVPVMGAQSYDYVKSVIDQLLQ